MVADALKRQGRSSADGATHMARLLDLWSGLPRCSVVVFRHLQKTGGSSVVRQFLELQHDLQWSVSGYWSPCWQGRGEHVGRSRLRWLRGLTALGRQANTSMGRTSKWPLTGALDLPPWPTRHLLHVHHPDAATCGGMATLQKEIATLRPFAPILGCKVTVAMLVREPWPFFVSWYYYIGAKRCSYCGFDEFVRLNVNAQSHLAMGGTPRVYSSMLRARHEARDSTLRRQLATVLAGIDVLGATQHLDDFMLRLCEAAGLRTCPRPGVRNPHHKPTIRYVLREVAKRSIAHEGLKGRQGLDRQSTRPGSVQGAARRLATGQSTRMAEHPLVNLVRPLAPTSAALAPAILRAVPNATVGSSHWLAADSASWLDTWLYEQALIPSYTGIAKDRVGGGGGGSVSRVEERRRQLEQWRALPEDKSSGCLQFEQQTLAAAATAAAAAEKVAAAAATKRAAAWMTSSEKKIRMALRSSRHKSVPVGAGGIRETYGLAVLPFDLTRNLSALSSAADEPRKLSGLQSTSGVANVNVYRCAALRHTARRLWINDHLPERPPEPFASALLPTAGGVQRDSNVSRLIALCSTMVRMPAVPRTCSSSP